LYRILFIIAVLPFLLVCFLDGDVNAGEVSFIRETQERFIGRLESSAFIPESLVVSPDGRHIAYTVRESGKKVVIVDGKPQKPYDQIRYYGEPLGGDIFSSDGKRIYYYGREDNRWYIVIDGKEEHSHRPSPDHFEWNGMVFSPDSTRAAFVAVDDHKKQYIVLDGIPLSKHDKIACLTFSPDGKQFAYSARDGEKEFIIVNHIKKKEYGVVGCPQFSPDSRRVVSIATTQGQRMVVVDGMEGKLYDRVFPRHWRKRVSDKNIGFSSYTRFYYLAQKGQDIVFVEETITPH